MDVNFFLPTKIKMQDGLRHQSGKLLNENSFNRVLIITDKGIVNAGLLEDIYRSLQKYNIFYKQFDHILPNPRDIDCDHIGTQFKDEQFDSILAIGGGSVIDTAKAVSILLTNGGMVKDYEGLSVADKDPLPIVCIPTTAGTGSEVTFWSIISDTKNNYKMAIGDPRIIPEMALLDPYFTATLPKPIAAGTGMDALTHAIEAYTCKVANPITDALALHAIKMIKENIIAAVDEKNEQAREHMLIGSLIAGAAFGNSDTAGVHCVSEAVGGVYDTPHGITNAIFLPLLFQYNISANIEKHAEVAYALGVDRSVSKQQAASDAVDILFDLNKRLEIPTFREIDNINPKDFTRIAELSVQSTSNPSNAREMNKADYIEILNLAYNE